MKPSQKLGYTALPEALSKIVDPARAKAAFSPIENTHTFIPKVLRDYVTTYIAIIIAYTEFIG